MDIFIFGKQSGGKVTDGEILSLDAVPVTNQC